MQILGMRIELNGKTIEIEREDQVVGGVALRHVRVAFAGEEGSQCLGVADREMCVELAEQIARDACGETRKNRVNCSASTLSDIADAIERVAGC